MFNSVCDSVKYSVKYSAERSAFNTKKYWNSLYLLLTLHFISHVLSVQSDYDKISDVWFKNDTHLFFNNEL